MPQVTVVKQEFADAIKEVLGDLSASRASYKTQISYEYIRKMTHGHVPSEAILEKFAKALNADLQKLRIAAGYEEPVNIVVLSVNPYIAVELKPGAVMTDEKRREVIECIRDLLPEEYSPQ